jgi:hypothetical protein
MRCGWFQLSTVARCWTEVAPSQTWRLAAIVPICRGIEVGDIVMLGVGKFDSNVATPTSN